MQDVLLHIKHAARQKLCKEMCRSVAVLLCERNALVKQVQSSSLLVCLEDLLSNELRILNARPHKVDHTPYIYACQRFFLQIQEPVHSTPGCALLLSNAADAMSRLEAYCKSNCCLSPCAMLTG